MGGLDATIDVIEYREGGDILGPRKLPGQTKHSNLSLKRGYTQNRDLWAWRKTTIDGVTERKSGAVILRDEGGEPVLRWEFREGWVSKYEGPALKATANEAAMESVEIAVEDVTLV